MLDSKQNFVTILFDSLFFYFSHTKLISVAHRTRNRHTDTHRTTLESNDDERKKERILRNSCEMISIKLLCMAHRIIHISDTCWNVIGITHEKKWAHLQRCSVTFFLLYYSEFIQNWWWLWIMTYGSISTRVRTIFNWHRVYLIWPYMDEGRFFSSTIDLSATKAASQTFYSFYVWGR